MKALGLGVVAVLGLGGNGIGTQVSATAQMQTILQRVEVPAGERMVLTAEGRGVQIYQCQGQAEKTEWVFLEPEASLSVNNAPVATHGAGPVWRHQDGSAVFGEVVASAPSPAVGALPLLLLRAKGHEGNDKGLLAKVNFVQRLETTGGVAPAGGCEVGARLRVPYTAVYRFYVAAQ